VGFPPSSGCLDLLEKLAWFWRRVGKRPSGGKADEKTSHGGATTWGGGNMSLSTASFKQHFQMYEENYHMFFCRYLSALSFQIINTCLWVSLILLACPDKY